MNIKVEYITVDDEVNAVGEKMKKCVFINAPVNYELIEILDDNIAILKDLTKKVLQDEAK